MRLWRLVNPKFAGWASRLEAQESWYAAVAVWRLARGSPKRTNAPARVWRLSSTEPGRTDPVMKSTGSFLGNSFLLEDASLFGLMKPRTDKMRPIQIVEGDLLYLKSTKLFIYFLNVYFWEREQARGKGRERGRQRDAKWALHWQESSMWVWSHEPWDHDLSQSCTLNWLSHPGTPR